MGALTPRKLRDPRVVPTEPVEVDWGHPLAAGLLSAVLLGCGGVDLSGGGNDAVAFGGPMVAGSNVGPMALLAGASSQGFSLRPFTFAAGATGGMSVVGLASRVATGQHGAFFKTGNATAASGGDGWAIGIGGGGFTGFETAGDVFTLLYEGVRWIPTSAALGVGPFSFGASLDASGFPSGYVDGALVYSDSGGAPAGIGGDGAPVTQIGGYVAANGANRYFTGSLQCVLPYGRVLSADEHAWFAAEPFCMLRPKR